MAGPVGASGSDIRPWPPGRVDRRLVVSESIYFAFVSGLTIGYGDFAPKTLVARVLAIMIGICGVLLTGLVAAVAVKALSVVRGGDSRK